jgi:hypothetical protein
MGLVAAMTTSQTKRSCITSLCNRNLDQLNASSDFNLASLLITSSNHQKLKFSLIMAMNSL